jgi:hypothetical protein
VVLGETNVAVGSISIVAVANLYDSKPPNPPPPPPVGANDADLVLTGSVVPSTLKVGDTFTETLTVTNKGPATATNVVLAQKEFQDNDWENSGSSLTIVGVGTCGGNFELCRFPSLAPNASAGWRFVAVVTKVNQAGSSRVVASVRADQNDPDYSNNSASYQSTVVASAAAALPPGGVRPPSPLATSR